MLFTTQNFRGTEYMTTGEQRPTHLRPVKGDNEYKHVELRGLLKGPVDDRFNPLDYIGIIPAAENGKGRTIHVSVPAYQAEMLDEMLASLGRSDVSREAFCRVAIVLGMLELRHRIDEKFDYTKDPMYRRLEIERVRVRSEYMKEMCDQAFAMVVSADGPAEEQAARYQVMAAVALCEELDQTKRAERLRGMLGLVGG